MGIRRNASFAALVFAIANIFVGLAQVRAEPTGRSSDPVTATFFGTSTLAFNDGRHVLLVDGFVSRPRLMSVVFGTVSPDYHAIEAAFSGLFTDRSVAVMVSHTHYDHALDAGTISKLWRAEIYGSSSTAMLLHAERVDDELINVIEPGESFSIGRFSVTATKTPHSPGDLAPGELRRPPRLPTTARAYRTGDSYRFHIVHGDARILVVPSAHHRADHMHTTARADVVFLGIGMLGKQSDGFIERYWCDTVLASGATVVVPIHWDDFTRPLAAPLANAPSWIDRVEDAMSALHRLARRDGVRVLRMDAFETLELDGSIRGRDPVTNCTELSVSSISSSR